MTTEELIRALVADTRVGRRGAPSLRAASSALQAGSKPRIRCRIRASSTSTGCEQKLASHQGEFSASGKIVRG
jgi:hypothetical protein